MICLLMMRFCISYKEIEVDYLIHVARIVI